MDKKTISRILFITSVLLLIAGVVFLVISILRENKSNEVLCEALGCILLSNLLNIINALRKKKDK